MKKKLFIPRKIFGEDSRWPDWNKIQPIIDNKPINQYDLDGRKQGMWYYFYDEEKTEFFSKGEYKNNIKIKIWEEYYGNGKLYQKSIYSNTGRKIGKWTIYDDNGFIKKIINYKNNSLIQTLTFHKNSNGVESIQNFKNNVLNGLKTSFHENGKPREKMFYINNQIDKWSFQFSKTGGLLNVIEHKSPKEKIQYLLSKNAIRNKKVWYRWKIFKEQKISQEDITNIINQAKSEAPFQI